MKDKKYIISEKDLRDLLYYYNKGLALESGGVDNWEWYGESISDYVNNFRRENDIPYDDDEEEFYLEDIVEICIKNFVEVNKNE